MDDNREKSFNLYSDGFCFLPKVFSEDQISSSDINADGTINVLDVVLLVNAVLGSD